MSTVKAKAKEVKKTVYNKVAKYEHDVYSHFETEDGRKFSYACYWRKDSGYDDPKTKFYICKYNYAWHGNEWRYWIYEIPRHQALRDYYGTGNIYPIHIENGFFVTEKK